MWRGLARDAKVCENPGETPMRALAYDSPELVLVNFQGKRRMLRTIFMIGLFALLGLFLLRVVFGILPALVGFLVGLAYFALKVAVVGFLIYLVIRVVSPDTARRLREKWSGPAV